jgi:hypothetical protein
MNKEWTSLSPGSSVSVRYFSQQYLRMIDKDLVSILNEASRTKE